MLKIAADKCKKCQMCVKNCPISAIETKKDGTKVTAVEITDRCVECGICRRVCGFGAIENDNVADGVVQCRSCPIQCKVPIGSTGACRRYTNEGGKLVRNRALVVRPLPQVYPAANILTPIITAVGAGTNYPCIRPAPHIVQETRDGVEIVTVVTEAPLSYSGLVLKLDTNTYIGEEGATVYRDGKPVGMVNTEEYGSKMIAIGGSNRLTDGNNGFMAARTICDLANGEEVTLSVDKKVKVTVQQGVAPIINGVQEKKMRIGCGSATIGLMAKKMKDAGLDECIVIDHHVTGLFSEHLAGEEVGMKWSGIVPNCTKSSRGRYFGDHGEGIGGTTFKTPRDAIGKIDMNVARAGMQLLVLNTTGEIYAMFEVNASGGVDEIPVTEAAMSVVTAVNEACQDSLTSVLYSGGTGGSARGGVCSKPLAITNAVHEGKAHLTIGGAPAFVYPGGGINFMVDTAKVVNKAFTWVPTPATVCPVEYTMTRADYEAIGGHMDCIKDVSEYK